MRRVHRVRRFTQRSLALASAAPPWHRGLVAVANIVIAVLIGLGWQAHWAVLVAPAFALFLTIADIEGPIRMRLATLCWSMSLIACGAALALTLRDDPLVFALAFVVLAYLVGIAAWAGAPIMTASRFAIITGLLMQGLEPAPLLSVLALLVVVAAVAAATRSLEAWLAPDRVVGDYSEPRVALFKVRAARPLLWRYAASYALVAALGWTLGRTVDAVHPTWVTVSTLVTMWPDAARSYERIVQRFFGTLAGALVTLGLIRVVSDPLILATVALAMAFFLPHFLRRNFWLHSALMVVLVLAALDVSSKTGFSPHLVAERIGDVMLGCAFAVLGTLLAFGRAHRLARHEAQRL